MIRFEVEAIADDESIGGGCHKVFDGMDRIANRLSRAAEDARSIEAFPTDIVEAVANVDGGER